MNYKTPDHIVDVIKENKNKDAFYIYDLDVMRYKMRLLWMLPENVDTYYAMKVNPHIDVVSEALKNENISWIEVASQWEIDVVLEAWEQDLSKVIYTWPSKSDKELKFCVQNHINYLNVESWKEAIMINMEAEKRWIVQPILMRLNTHHEFAEWEAWVTLSSWDTQFWFPQDETIQYLSLLDQLKNIRVDWFHMYPATWIMEADVLLRSVDETFRFVQEVENKTWKEFKTIDFWWWFWINYWWFKEFDIGRYSEWLQKLIEKYWMEYKKFILELGRYLWSDMWFFVTKVNDIKTLSSWKKWVLCHAWTNSHKRPQVLNVDYHVDVVEVQDEMAARIYQISKELWLPIDIVRENDAFNVYWPLCTSVDKVALNKTWKDIKIWDFIVQPQTWAYWKTMSPQAFLSHPEIEEIVINK